VLSLLAFLPARWSGWTEVLGWLTRRAVVPVSDPIQRVGALVLGTSEAPSSAVVAQLERERDHFKWMWHQQQRETERLQKTVEQLQKGQLLSELPVRQLVRPVVGSSSDGRGGELLVRAGASQGLAVNDVATTEGVQIVGKVVSTSAKLASVRLITSPAAGGITGLVFTSDDKPGVKCSLSPSKAAPVLNGYVEYSRDGKAAPEVGQTVRLEDPQWPKHAQRLVIGTITAVKTVTTGRQVIEVKPTVDLDRLSEVVLRLTPKEADERPGSALATPAKAGGDGRP
jgi:cell shape-determining protein MreC